MTDVPAPIDPATQARLDALRQRRATSSPVDRHARPTARRRHAAMGGRILAGSLSASAALALTAMMAGAGPGATVAGPSPAPPPAPVVIVVPSGSDTARSADAAPSVTFPVAPPVTSSQAS